MSYKIYLGNSKCTKCGKSHKKIFEIDGKPYGSSCAKEILGKNLSAPVWLYQIAENYIQKRIKSDDIEEYVGDFEVNFWNELPDVPGTVLGKSTIGNLFESYLYQRSIKIENKPVKLDWQFEIVDYLHQRYEQINLKDKE